MMMVMKIFKTLLPLVYLTSAIVTCQDEVTWKPVYYQPEHVHLSLGENPYQWVVTWTTFDPTNESTVWYGPDESMNLEAHGTETKFVDGGSLQRQMFIHRVYLDNLKPATSYRYHCGSSAGWSEVFFFRTFPNTTNWSPRFVLYGDLGNLNGQTLGRLQDEVQRGRHDVLLHVGDMAYDMHTDNARVGDEFMRQIQPISAYLPYQVCPGNHESAYNFSNYVSRFSMHSEGSKEVNNHFWSYNIGPVHLISFSTEFHYFPEFGTSQIRTQYRWLEQDLIEANKPENRAKHPWIITMGHRPMYVQRVVDDNIRKGNHTFPGFEELFYKYGVDLEFWAHWHNYQRNWPIYNNKIMNGSLEEPYRNPKAPVHITTGSAGCRENKTPVYDNFPDYSAKVISEYGFTYMKVLNSTHLHLQQISEERNGAVIDEIYLIKEKHGPEAWL